MQRNILFVTSYLQIMLQTLLERKAVRGRQGIRIVSGIVMAAAAAREFSRFAGRALRHARVPLHFIDDVQIRIVHRRGRTRGGAVSIARPVPGIPPPRHVQVIRNTDGVLRCRARAQTTCQLHLLLLLLLHHVLDRASTNIFRLHLPVHGINTLHNNKSKKSFIYFCLI